MLKKLLTGAGLTALLATAVLAQDVAQPGAQPNRPAPARRRRGTWRRRGAGGGGPSGAIPTRGAMESSPEAQAYVAKAKEIAGNDPDLQFDAGYNCTPAGTPQGNGPSGGGPGGDDAVSGNAGIPFVPMPSGTAGMAPHACVRQSVVVRDWPGRLVADHDRQGLHPVRHAGQRGTRNRRCCSTR